MAGVSPVSALKAVSFRTEGPGSVKRTRFCFLDRFGVSAGDGSWALLLLSLLELSLIAVLASFVFDDELLDIRAAASEWLLFRLLLLPDRASMASESWCTMGESVMEDAFSTLVNAIENE